MIYTFQKELNSSGTQYQKPLLSVYWGRINIVKLENGMSFSLPCHRNSFCLARWLRAFCRDQNYPGRALLLHLLCIVTQSKVTQRGCLVHPMPLTCNLCWFLPPLLCHYKIIKINYIFFSGGKIFCIMRKKWDYLLKESSRWY